jgi:hypothetical protein
MGWKINSKALFIAILNSLNRVRRMSRKSVPHAVAAGEAFDQNISNETSTRRYRVRY